MNKRQLKKRYMDSKKDFRLKFKTLKKAKRIHKKWKAEIMRMLRENKNITPTCKGYGCGIGKCEYDSTWLCKNPHAKTPVITSTLYGAYPSGCPKVYDWNYKEINNEN